MVHVNDIKRKMIMGTNTFHMSAIDINDQIIQISTLYTMSYLSKKYIPMT